MPIQPCSASRLIAAGSIGLVRLSAGPADVAGKAVLQHFLQEGIRRVAARNAMPRDGIEDLSGADAASLAR